MWSTAMYHNLVYGLRLVLKPTYKQNGGTSTCPHSILSGLSSLQISQRTIRSLPITSVVVDGEILNACICQRLLTLYTSAAFPAMMLTTLIATPRFRVVDA